jgi:hypothetical protein
MLDDNGLFTLNAALLGNPRRVSKAAHHLSCRGKPNPAFCDLPCSIVPLKGTL